MTVATFAIVTASLSTLLVITSLLHEMAKTLHRANEHLATIAHQSAIVARQTQIIASHTRKVEPPVVSDWRPTRRPDGSYWPLG